MGRWGSGTITSLLCTWGVGAKSASVCIVQLRYSFGITVQHGQMGEEDGFSSRSMHASVCVCVHECVCLCVLLSCAHACIHHRPHHTTHTLTRFLDSGVFLPGSIWSAESTATSQSSQISRSGLLNLSQSLQDLLKYCWVPLGGGDKRVGLEKCADTFRCVCTHVNGAQFYVCLAFAVWLCDLIWDPPYHKHFPPLHHAPAWVCVWGEKGHRWWNTYIIYIVLWL